MRLLRFTAKAIDELRAERKEADGFSPNPKKRFAHPYFNLPQIASDPVGYERQVLADLQLGLMCLHEPVMDRGTALMNIREGES